MEFLSKVEYTFTVPTRGCVVVPVALSNPELRVRVGDAIQLRSEIGILDARIKQVELIKQSSGPGRVGLLLSSEICKSQIPPGAEIWVDRPK
jgi:hypothetical protein